MVSLETKELRDEADYRDGLESSNDKVGYSKEEEDINAIKI